MADDAKKSPKNWFIAALIALVVIGLAAWLMTQNGRGGDQQSATSDSMPAEDGNPTTAQPSGAGGSSAPAGDTAGPPPAQ